LLLEVKRIWVSVSICFTLCYLPSFEQTILKRQNHNELSVCLDTSSVKRVCFAGYIILYDQFMLHKHLSNIRDVLKHRITCMNIAICTTPGETPMQQGTYEMVETYRISEVYK
jgi:hypothetical protein